MAGTDSEVSKQQAWPSLGNTHACAPFTVVDGAALHSEQQSHTAAASHSDSSHMASQQTVLLLHQPQGGGGEASTAHRDTRWWVPPNSISLPADLISTANQGGRREQPPAWTSSTDQAVT